MFQRTLRMVYCAFGRSYPLRRSIRVFENGLTRWLTSSMLEPVVTTTRGGCRLLVIPSEHIGRHIYFSSSFEPHLLDLMTVLSRDKRIFVDIGANVGFFSIELAHANPNLAVYAVEPQPILADMIARSAALSGVDDRICIYKYAVSDVDGEAEFAIIKHNLGESMIASSDYRGDTIRVPVITGTKMLDLIGENDVDLLKVDIEGHEHRFFSSIEPWLARQRIAMIIFETRGHGDDNATINLVRRCGYRTFSIRKDFMGPSLRELGQGLTSEDEDMLAVRPREFASVKSRIHNWLKT
jgi:FkbM family methyltransferase